MEETIECPYCEQEETVYIELEDLEDGGTYITECSNCEKQYGVYMELTWAINSPHKVPCSNGEGCRFLTKIYGHPDGFKKRCCHCGTREE